MIDAPIPKDAAERAAQTWRERWGPWMDCLCSELGFDRAEALAFLIALRLNEVVSIWNDMAKQQKETFDNSETRAVEAHEAYMASRREYDEAQRATKRAAEKQAAFMDEHGPMLRKIADELDEEDGWKGESE